MKRLQILKQLFLEKAAGNRLNRRIHLLSHLFKALIFFVHTPLSNWFKVNVIPHHHHHHHLFTTLLGHRSGRRLKIGGCRKFSLSQDYSFHIKPIAERADKRPEGK